MLHGADIARPWNQLMKNLENISRIKMTSSLPRPMPLQTNSKMLMFKDSQQSNSGPRVKTGKLNCHVIVLKFVFREGVDYNGGRDLEALVKFVESGGTEGNEAGDDDEDVSP